MSIFFNFDVGSSGRRFRRAVDGDKCDISLFNNEESEKLFGTTDIGSLIEVSVLSICMINEEKYVVGFMALGDRPNVPGVDPADWEIWIRNMFQRYYLSRNTLFIHYSCCLESVDEYFLDEALVSVFNNDVHLHQIVLVIPGDCPGDILLKYQIMKKRNVYRYNPRREDDLNSNHCLITYARQEFCPKLRMRRAVEEDNDDIVQLLEKTCPKLKELYGDYYISEIIGRHPESKKKIIIAEYLDRPVGVMCLNTDINYRKLNAGYDLRPHFGLMKATSLEKQKAKKANELLQTFGEPIMIGKWRPYQEINKVEIGLDEEVSKKTTVKTKEPSKSSRVNFGYKPIRKSLEDIMFSHRHSDDFSEKVYLESPTQSQVTVYSVADLLEEDPFDYELINIDKELLNIPDVMSFSTLSKKVHWKENKPLKRKRRPSLNSVKHSNTEEADTFLYEGQPNAFMIELLGFHDDLHERHVFDLLEAAFELMKIFDYCIIKVPCAEKTFPLLQYFCFVPTKNNICSPYALYVAHRSAVLGKLRVREAEVFDIPQIANLLKDLDGRETLWTIEHSLHHKDIHKAYVFLSGLSIVGVGIVEPAEKIDFIRARYNLDLYHNHKYHTRGNANGAFTTLKVVQAYSVFEVHFRFFIREMMRLSGSSSVLWMTAYRNKLVANKANSLASEMVPLMPRLTEINCVNVPELRNIKHMSQNITSFSSWFLGRKLTSVPKMDINARIVVIGASRTAMAFLNALIFSDASLYLNFTSVTLISPNGLHYIRQEKPIVEMMFPKYRTHTDKYLKSVPYTYYVNIIHGTMTDIDKRNKFVTLSNGNKYNYDLLFLFLGRQYQHPNYLINIYEKEKEMRCAYKQHYVRLDVPRYLDSDFQIINENIPENVFIINNKAQANMALDFVKNLKIQNDSNYKILVYGASIHAYCCIASLMELMIPPEKIVYIEPFPPEDEKKLRVSVFCNAYVDQTMIEMLESLKIMVYRSYYFQSWSVDEYNFVNHVHFLSYFQLLTLECSALFYYGRREISMEALDAVIKSGIVHDGGILIDNECRTRDPFVYAAGPATRYCRRYFAETFRQKYYDSYEIGYKLGVQIRNQLDPLFTAKKEQKKQKTSVRFSILSEITECTSNNSSGISGKSTCDNLSNITGECDEKLPVFKKPITIHCTLPGGLQYLEVRPPGLKTPNYYVQTFEYNGFVMETFKEGYFKLHCDKDYIVNGITCLTPERNSVENFKNLYGLSAIVLNNVHIRYTTMKLDNFYEFFRSPWAFFLYHQQCDELFAMAKELRPKGQRKGNTLGEGLMAVGDKLSHPSFRFDTKMKIRSKFEHSPHVEAITDYVIEWLSENDVLLPMYLQPSHLGDYLHDLDRHPAFKKKKTTLIKMFKKIF